MKTYCIGLLSLLTMGSIQPVVASSADPLNTIQKKMGGVPISIAR